MVEEESPEAEVNPDGATNKNGKYLHRALLPLLQDLSILKKIAPGNDRYSSARPDSQKYPISWLPARSGSPAVCPLGFKETLQYLLAALRKQPGLDAGALPNRGAEWVIEPLRKTKGSCPGRVSTPGNGSTRRHFLRPTAVRLSSAGTPRAFAAALIAAQDSDGYLGVESRPSERDIRNGIYGISSTL